MHHFLILQGVGEREFLAELGTLGRVRHRNLVSLRGYCVTQDECFLVLDYAANGNLDAALRHSKKRSFLRFEDRPTLCASCEFVLCAKISSLVHKEACRLPLLSPFHFGFCFWVSCVLTLSSRAMFRSVW